MRKLIVLSLATTSLLLGAVPVPKISDIVRETVLPQDLAPTQTVPLVEIGGVEKYAPGLDDNQTGKTIFVKAFKITGAKHMDVDTLQGLIAPYVNKELTFGKLQEAASIVTNAYRTKGYFVALAYIPTQTMKDGIVEIAVIEGKYGEFKLSNSSLVQDTVLQGILDDAKSAEVVSTDSLERAMLIINDAAGVKVTQMGVMPGTAVGTSDFTIRTEPTKRYDGFVLGDNYGSLYTGYYRFMVGLNLNSLASIGDKLSFVEMISNDSLQYSKVSYGAPLMSNGLRGELGYSKTYYALGDTYTSLDATGEASTIEASLTYPYIRTRRESLSLTSGIAIRKLADYQSNSTISDKDINAFTVGANYTKEHILLGYDAKQNSSLTLTYGNLKIKDSDSITTDAAGANTQGYYNKLNGSISETMTLNDVNSLNVNLIFQKVLGSKNLDGTEDFSVVGSNGVKVYPTSELSAENGVMLNTEVFQTLSPIENVMHKIGLFHDIGKVWMADDSKVSTFESRTLQDIGVGYYAGYDDFFAKAQLAYIIGGGHVTSEPNHTMKILVQIGMSF